MPSLPTFWSSSILPALVDTIRIPAKSPHFEPDWAKNGHIDAAVTLAEGWCRQHAPANTKIEVVRLPDHAPVLFLELPATAGAKSPVLIYGHLDKQPKTTDRARLHHPALTLMEISQFIRIL